MQAVSAEFRLFGCFDEFYWFLVFLRFPHQDKEMPGFWCPFFAFQKLSQLSLWVCVRIRRRLRFYIYV